MGAMSVWQIVGGVLIVLLSLAIVILVLLQESPKGSGVSALGGGGDSYYNKNQGRSMDAMLSRLTKWAAIIFFVITILANVLPRFL